MNAFMASTLRQIRSLCVFCGSRVGSDGRYAEAARELGRALAERGMTLVYGGGQIGLMGVLADAVLAAGGRVVGVIPQPLATRELLHPRATEMHVVPDFLRQEYRRIMKEQIAFFEKECQKDRIDYALLESSQPLDRALFAYLLRREQLY